MALGLRLAFAPSSSGILPRSKEERQDAAATYAFPPSLEEMQNEKSLPGDVAHHRRAGP
jgi:hypothetical protein